MSGDPWDFDVLVVGAGPAGALAARDIARLGSSVLLVDRRVFPRSKVCGACFHPRALDELHAAGLGHLVASIGGRNLEVASIRARGRELRVALERPGAVLSRSAFDMALVATALEAGAHGMFGAAATLAACEAGAVARHLRIGELDVRASIVVAADGLGGALLARTKELELPPRRGARIGIGALLPADACDVPVGEVRLAVAAEGYAGAARLEDGSIDVAAAVDAHALTRFGAPALIARIVRAAGGPAYARLEDAIWRGTVPLARKRGPAAAWRVFAIGDAAGYVEPFSGEGIAWALRGARALAPIAHAAVGRYSPDVRELWQCERARHLDARQRACARIAALVRSPLAVSILAQAARAAPRLATRGVGRAWGAARATGVPAGARA